MAAQSVLVVAVVALAAIATPLALAAPLPALGTPLLALPGAWLTGYATPAAVVAPSGTLNFLNLDLMQHNVVALTAVGPDNQPWCEFSPAGECPLFWSEWTPGLGGQSEVRGLENTTPGASYSYYCVPHPVMRGTLVVLPEAP